MGVGETSTAVKLVELLMLDTPNFLTKNKKVKYFFIYIYLYEFLKMDNPCDYTK